VYVLGRLPGSGGAGTAGDSGVPSGGASGSGASTDSGAAGDGSCVLPVPLRDFVFFGAGTQVSDRRGGPPGEIRGGAALDDSGELTLDGEDDYVDLPNGILSGLSEVTVVVWIRYLGGAAYTRIFDFGVGRDGEDPAPGLATVGRTYLAATPMTGFVPRYLAALVTNEGSAGQIAAVTDYRLDDGLHMVAVAVSTSTLELFVDGAVIAREPNSVELSSIEDVTNWLGRSQYDQDPHLDAIYAGVQIFDRALAECAIGALHAGGPARR
jgi:hypothetical protein